MKKLIHTTTRISSIVRKEIYEYNEYKYVEEFDDLTDKRICGTVSIDGTEVCDVEYGGSISLYALTEYIVDKDEIPKLIEKLKGLYEFLGLLQEETK